MMTVRFNIHSVNILFCLFFALCAFFHFFFYVLFFSLFRIIAMCGDYYIGGRRFSSLSDLIGYYSYVSCLLKGEKLLSPVAPPEVRLNPRWGPRYSQTLFFQEAATRFNF